MEQNLQKVSTNWNYDKSVEITKNLVSQFKKCSLGIVRELYSATLLMFTLATISK